MNASHEPNASGTPQRGKFRVKIWDGSGAIVYDNQVAAPDAAEPTTVIGGGSIAIHPN